MKKVIVLGLVAILAGATFVFGPDLLGLYRLQRHIAAQTQAADADEGPWPRLTEACTTCHGVKGNALSQGYPSLAGEPAGYLRKQLLDFREGRRDNPTMRSLAMALKPADLDRAVAYFATQARTANTYFTPPPELRESGRRLVDERGCAACHGEQLTGQDRFPRIAGQGFDYLVAQLDAFAAGGRTEASGTMQRLAAAATPQERRAMAAYLANLDAGAAR